MNYASPSAHASPNCKANGPKHDTKISGLTDISFKSWERFSEIFTANMSANEALKYMELNGACYRKRGQNGASFPY